LRSRIPPGNSETGLERARRVGALAMVKIGKEEGDEGCLAGMERALHCAPWEKEPREKLRIVREAVEKREGRE